MTFLLDVLVNMQRKYVCTRVHFYLEREREREREGGGIEQEKKGKYFWERQWFLSTSRNYIRNGITFVNHPHLYSIVIQRKRKRWNGTTDLCIPSLSGISFFLRSYSNLLLERSSRLADAKTSHRKDLPYEFLDCKWKSFENHETILRNITNSVCETLKQQRTISILF